jgi:asparagine synthase (glutamine-hydrolysing)
MLGEKFAGLELPQRNIPFSHGSARRLLFDVLQYEQTMRFSGEFLTKVDGGTMHYAVEARSPLLDQKLWEFAATLPPQIRLRGGVLKAVLRKIVSRNIGPQVASRKKRGFTIPVERWLATRWSDALRQLSSGSMLASEGWIRPVALRDSIDSALRRGEISTQLWYLLVFEHWLQRQGHPAGHSVRAGVV